MKTKSAYTIKTVYWSNKHFEIKKNLAKKNIYEGYVLTKDNEKIFFHSAGQLLQIHEKLYKKYEKN